jgi:hypothetical protein
MKMKVADFIQQIDAADYQVQTLTTADANEKVTEKELVKILQPLFDHFSKLIASEALGRVEQPLNFADQTVIIALETGVINLPFANNNRVDNFFENDAETEILANLILTSPELNASGLRIDTLGEVSQWSEKNLPQQAVTLVAQNLKQLAENLAK